MKWHAYGYFATAQLGDIVTTLIADSKGGTELNPLLQSMRVMVVSKVLLTLAIALLVYWWPKAHTRMIYTGLSFAGLISWIVVVSNLFTISSL